VVLVEGAMQRRPQFSSQLGPYQIHEVPGQRTTYRLSISAGVLRKVQGLMGCVDQDAGRRRLFECPPMCRNLTRRHAGCTRAPYREFFRPRVQLRHDVRLFGWRGCRVIQAGFLIDDAEKALQAVGSFS
jgi:hypothetical protein